MTKYNDYIIDLETLGDKSNAAVVDISIIPFNPDENVMQSFDELVAQGKKFKISFESQKGKREFAPHVIKWWKDKSPEAKQNLKPLPDDLTVEDAINQILQFLKDNNIDQVKSQAWCRGQSFDFPIFLDMIVQTFGTTDTFHIEPIRFWNQRDIRTAIEALSLVRNVTTVPLKKGSLDGFVHHDSIHDCAKDILMLKAAKRYALGLEEYPSKDEIDPLSVTKR